MNPSKILPRETRLATPPARKPQGTREDTRVDFRLPADEPREAAAARGQREDQVRRAELIRNGRADARDEDLRGSDRSRQVRQDDRANRGEAAGNRSVRADGMSSRDKTHHCDKAKHGNRDCGDAASAETDAAEGLSPEDAARLALSEAVAGLSPKIQAEAGDGKPADAPAAEGKAETQAAITAETPAVDSLLGLPQPASLEIATKIGTPNGDAEAAAIDVLTSGQPGNKAAPAVALALNAGPPDELSRADKADPQPAGKAGSDTLESSAAKPDEPQAAPTRTAQDAKPDASAIQAQTAAPRTEPLPPGLIALPDAARALQALEADGKPGLGPQHSGPRPPESPPTSLAALPIEIGFRALSGTKRFDIRLDPPELGRVDVTLTFDKEGEVTAKLTVDRVETLHLLQRDAKTLERAFDQAGLRPSDAGVQISLSDRNSGNGSGFEAEQERARSADRRDNADTPPANLIEMAPMRRVRLGGVDVNV